MLAFIWAEDSNHGIGYQGQLPWHMPADMKFFKDTTTGNTIVAGRKTFESFKRPLHNRKNIVLTSRDEKDFPEGVVVYHSVKEVLEYYTRQPSQKMFIIGGVRLFEEFLPYATDLYRTTIDHEFAVDTYMPEIDYNHFMLSDFVEGKVDEKNKYPHHIEHFMRVEPENE